MKWFVIVGRSFGDDEATALAIHAADAGEAQASFIKTMREIAGFLGVPPADGHETEGTVWIDATFDCGATRPVEL